MRQFFQMDHRFDRNEQSTSKWINKRARVIATWHKYPARENNNNHRHQQDHAQPIAIWISSSIAYQIKYCEVVFYAIIYSILGLINFFLLLCRLSMLLGEGDDGCTVHVVLYLLRYDWEHFCAIPNANDFIHMLSNSNGWSTKSRLSTMYTLYAHVDVWMCVPG